MSESIDAMDFGDPEVRGGKLVLPITVWWGHGGKSVTVYLTRSKLETLEREAKAGQSALDEVATA